MKSDGRGLLPLAAADERLGRRPGHLRKTRDAESAQALQAEVLAQTAERIGLSRGSVPEVCPLTPRLLDVVGAAKYLGVSLWTIRDLDAAGHLARVRLPLGVKEIRRVLYDRADLDLLIDRSKDR